MDESTFKEAVRHWIVERAGLASAETLGNETEIISDGILTSLDVVELILLIEELRGEEVEVESLEPESFRDLNTVVATFYNEPTAKTGT